MAKAKPRIYIIDGEIAAGKSALTRALTAALSARGLRVAVCPEPVENWVEVGILQKFYEDPARYAYEFQTYVYATRVLGIVECFEQNPDAEVFILERSPATDVIFMELQRGDVPARQMKMYAQWCKAFTVALPFDLASARVLYLQTSLGRCMQRLAERCRTGEIIAADAGAAGDAAGTADYAVGGVSLKYQERLRRAHRAYFLREGLEEFPDMPTCPFAPEAIIVIGTDLADADFRLESPGHEAVVAAIVSKMGL